MEDVSISFFEHLFLSSSGPTVPLKPLTVMAAAGFDDIKRKSGYFLPVMAADASEINLIVIVLFGLLILVLYIIRQ